MIHRIEGTKNGYQLDETSTNDQWVKVCEDFGKVRCIICNRFTSQFFHTGLFSNNIVTVNNKLPDYAVYLNGVF